MFPINYFVIPYGQNWPKLGLFGLSLSSVFFSEIFSSMCRVPSSIFFYSPLTNVLLSSLSQGPASRGPDVIHYSRNPGPRVESGTGLVLGKPPVLFPLCPGASESVTVLC